MINKANIGIVDILLLGTMLLFLVELLFLNTGLLIFSVIFILLVYFGKKTYYRPRGKFMFWVGAFFLAVTVMNTIAFKVLLMVGVIYFVYKWYKSKQDPAYYAPQFTEHEPDEPEKIVRKKVVFTNNWFGEQKTPPRAYEWQDVNIQTAVGDVIIDLNYTVIPKSEPVVVIRNLVGNVQIRVPYDVEVSVHHSVMFGTVKILDHVEPNVWNKVLHLETPNYSDTNQKVKIFTSMVVGKIEVIRG
ncbi:cell wall-active antibiotics response protein LiaF [Aquibacillus albus]|uniref:Lia operon protein LiaF n=1 Tax=Aquibacillus albus TaxID=1168171 RepID=A0ABS2MXC9_9BACI|nr:cell wall-active antibiotics response protein LiaF [Aquibacillus albus]MBM7570549.1 lia operon protein LiaF [Aquibacillus albus]